MWRVAKIYPLRYRETVSKAELSGKTHYAWIQSFITCQAEQNQFYLLEAETRTGTIQSCHNRNR